MRFLRTLVVLICAIGLGLFADDSRAQFSTGGITASPTTVIAPAGSSGTTELNWWASEDVASTYLSVSLNGGAAQPLFPAGPNGAATITWIVPGNYYVFYLDANCAGCTPLASVTVYGVSPAGSISANPTTIVIPNGSLGSSTISWSASNVSSTWVTLVANGGAEQVFASGGTTGSATAPWIQAGSSYVFTLRADSSAGAVLSSVTVTGQYPPVPSCTVSASPASIAVGQQSTLSVSCSNGATSFNWSNPNGGPLPSGTGGSYTFGAAGTYAYSVQGCNSSGCGAYSAAASVSVSGPVSVDSFTQLDSFGQPAITTISGASYNISWRTSNATSCVIDFSRNGETPYPVFSTALNGDYTVSPTVVGTHVWRITCQGAGSSTDTRTFTHYVNAPNQAPSVSLTAPTNGQSIVATSNGQVYVTITGAASDADGSVTQVEILRNGALQQTIPGSTVSSGIWLAIGSHTLQLRATDNQGLTALSNAASVTVTPPLPTVTLMTPVSGAMYNSPATIVLTSTAVSNGGSITSVAYYNNGTLIGSSTSSPSYAVTWSGVAPGTYTNVTARATNSLGGVSNSAPATVTVNPVGDGANYVNVGQTSTGGAASGGTFTAGLTYEVNAVNPNGYVVRVELREGASVLKAQSYSAVIGSNGEPSNALRAGTLTAPLGVGTHTLFLRTFTDSSATDSPLFTVTVTSANLPNIYMTAPTNGAQFATANTGFAAVPIAGSASFPGLPAPQIQTGSVLSIDVLDNGTPIANFQGGSIPGGATLTLAPGSHAIRLRVNDNLQQQTLGPLSTVTVSAAVSADIFDSPKSSQAGGSYTVTWSSANATSCLVDFSRNGEAPFPPFSTATSGTFNASTSIVGNVIWRITCQGPGGPVTKQTNPAHLVNPIGNAPISVNLTAPSSVTAGAGGTGTINLTGSAQDSDGYITKLELFVDTSGSNNFSSIYVLDNLTSPTANLSYPYVAVPGVYEFIMRATDNSGNVVQSNTVSVTVVANNFLGNVGGLRSDSVGNVALFGWACQSGSPTALNYQVWIDERTAAAGGTQIGSGIANVATEFDNSAIQTACNTLGSPHHFVFDVSSISSQYSGRQIYVQAIISGNAVNIPCGANNCTMPGAIRIGLTTPADGDRYTDPATVFMRAQISNSTGPYDDVSFTVDGGTPIKGLPDTAAQNNSVFYAFNDSPLAARAAPYLVVAKVVKGNVTLLSVANRIYVDAASGATLALTSPVNGALAIAGAPISLSATLGGTPVSGAVVKFYANGKLLSTGTQSGAVWTSTWSNATVGTYSVVARAVESSGRVAAQSQISKIIVSASGAVSAATIPVVVTVPFTGNAIAGTLPGAMSVSKEGAANYGIDIAVPPGTAGLAPKLSLSYSSQGTDGYLGLGWTLSGLSSIHRCGQTIAQDGVNGRVSFDLNDRLCLDGQRLVLANNSMSDANYWANGAEYRTEIDSFTRVTAQGATLATRTFKAEAKDGRVMYYGNTTTSLVNVYGTTKSGPLAWAISQINDRAGNYINFEYTQSTSTGEHLPSVIRYGAVGLPSHAAVQFVTQSRPDRWKRYVDQARNDRASLISAIKTYYGSNLDGPPGSSGWNLVRTNTMNYAQSNASGRSLLQSVQVCGLNETTLASECLPATTFAWGQNDPTKSSPGFALKGNWSGAPILTTTAPAAGGGVNAANHAGYFAFSDFNNDGRTDVLEKRVASPTVSAAGAGVAFAKSYEDANSIQRGTLQNQYRYFHNNGSGFTQYAYQLNTGEKFAVLATGDFNGDGSPDLVVSTEFNGAKICVSPLGQLNSPGSTSVPLIFNCGPTLVSATSMPMPFINDAAYIPFVVDVVGNGLSSIYSRFDSISNGAWLCRVADPASVSPSAAPAMTCALDPNAPTVVVGNVDAIATEPDSALNAHVSFDQMVDFAGTGKPSDVRWSIPYLTKFVDDGGQTVGPWRWVPDSQPTPRIVVTEFKVPVGTPPPLTFSGYNYPAYTSVPPTAGNDAQGNPIPNVGGLPYFFDKPAPGASIAADFNGSGYSSLAFGFVELTPTSNGPTYNLNKTQFTTCLSTGRGLDCTVRKKYSGSSYRSIRAVGQFTGTGQPTILAERLTFPSGTGFPNATGDFDICRIIGDDTTGGSGTGDNNIVCDAALGPKLPTNDPGVLSATDKTFFMDLLGTGRTQLVIYRSGTKNASGAWVENGAWEVYEPIDRAVVGQALDRIYKVTNGLGHTSTVEYKDGVPSGTVTRSGTVSASYPRYVNSGVGRIVSRLRVNTGGSAERSTTYQYQDSGLDLSGRGSLGFAKVIATDEQSGMVSTSVYRHEWPYTGMMSASTVTRAGVTLSSTSNTLNSKAIPQANGLSTAFAYTASSTATRNDLDGSSLGSELTAGVDAAGSDVAEVQYDNWGNMTGMRTVKTGSATSPTASFTSRTVNEFFPANVSSWLVGLLKNTSVSNQQSSDGISIKREKSYTYDSAGRILTDVTEPNDTNLTRKRTTTYVYNTIGLPSSKSIAWRDLFTGSDVTAMEGYVYDSKGRYVSQLTNAKGHVETRLASPRSGTQTSLTGPNQLTTNWALDGFGRVEKESRADGTYTLQYRKQCQGGCPVAGAVMVEISDTFSGADRIASPSINYLNNLGQVVRSQTWGFDGSVIVADRTYDSRGRLVSEEQPHYSFNSGQLARSRGYDDLDRVTSAVVYDEASPNGLTTTTSFQGFTQTLTNPKSQIRTEKRDVLGRVEQVVDPKNGLTQFSYDAFNNLTKTIDPNGNVITVTYDLLGRKTDLRDPNLGWVEYKNDARGLVWKQISPKQRALGQFTRTEFDLLGRMTARYEPDLESHWDFDTAAKGIGQLAEAYTMVGASKDYRRVHTFDTLGRPSLTTQYLSDAAYTQLFEYDPWGRLIKQTYQRGADAAKIYEPRYNAWGYLYQWQRDQLVLSRINKQDAAQQATEVVLGNGLTDTRTIDTAANRLKARSLGNSVTSQVRLTESYVFDSLGNINLRSQYWDSTGFSETFGYDELNRIINSQVSGQSQQVFSYDAVGNILSKTGVGTGSNTYSYPVQGATSVRPHAVSSITGFGSFAYDDNGNLQTAPSGRTATWTSFDMPASLSKGGTSASFVYGPEHQRTRQSRGDGSQLIYAGPQEVETNSSGQRTVKTYWPSGIGVEIDRPPVGANPATLEFNWTHTDRLGSVIAITASDGTLREKLAFDAWGKRRTLDGAPISGTPTPDSLDGVTDNRGYTGHEMLDQLDLVHMNGRIYDPLVAKFLSGDPILQDPMNGQSYNRYSYVMNNPTNLTDPTGFVSGTTGCNAGNPSRLSNDCGGGTLNEANDRREEKTKEADRKREQPETRKSDGSGNPIVDNKKPANANGSLVGQIAKKVDDAINSALDWIVEQVGFKDAAAGTVSLGNASIAAAYGDSAQARMQIDSAADSLNRSAENAASAAVAVASGGEAIAAGVAVRGMIASARGLSFGRKLDFLFNKAIDQANPYNAARASGNAERIGIADTAANRAEVARLFNQAYRDPSSIVGPGKVPGSNLREFFLPGVTGTGSKIQFVEKGGQVITIIAR